MEQWRPVVGYEGLYDVSDLGRVRSVDRVASDGRGIRGRMRALTPNSKKTKHLQLLLWRDNKYQKCYAHILVAHAFIGPSPEGTEVCHKNGREDDNRPENLYYGTRQENMLDAVEHGHWANQFIAAGTYDRRRKA